MAKRNAWIAPVVILLGLFSVITAQPGFLSISCGGKTNHTAENNITWVIDAPYIDVGQAADVGGSSELGSYLHTMRYFPKPLDKSCYHLPVTPDVPHLLRLWFPSGNFFPSQNNFSYSIETMDMSYVNDVMIESSPSSFEHILVTKGRELYICLVRTSEIDDPAISAIEMRRLQHGMYKDAQPGTILFTVGRYDVGGNSKWVRYPQDRFDRIWTPDPHSGYYLQNISSKEAISAKNTNDLPPTAVLQTAGVVNLSYTNYLDYSLPFNGEQELYEGPVLLMFYFAETQRLNMSQSRSFSFRVPGAGLPHLVTLRPNYSAQEITVHLDMGIVLLSPNKSSDSTLPPIINAYEYYALLQSAPQTNLQDTAALNAIKSTVGIKGWISPDPCNLIPWEGIGCDRSMMSDGVRISGIDLSERNLKGSVPWAFANLTALVNLSLNDNYFIGRMPNLGTTNLERLYLQNNNLNGTVEWLPDLIYLRELSLSNNQFTGEMPIFDDLNQLELLYLHNNKLNGNVDWLSNLKNLRELSLDVNYFTGPMPNLGNLTKLERLYLRNNHLNGTVEWLPDLIYLRELYLHNNKLNGNVDWLSNLKNLRELSLDVNYFTGPMPNLGNLTKLERLHLQNNNLNGTVEWLSDLISLQELSLNENQFMGPMPNLANLTKLERLYLQNNKLNGSVEWLYDLKNLQELNIENNNFSGVFLAQLLHNCSLKLNYSGNPYLQIGQRECNLQNGNTNKNSTNENTDKNVDKNKNENRKLVVVLGILFIAMIVDQFVKLKIKEKLVTTESSGAKKEPKHFLKQDRSKIMVPITTKSRAFTLDEMIVATQNFSREIGRGGFGSVFFGELPEGKAIAVKVLSLSSHQGIQEFLNEVDLLSKINHRDLVSLLGYCNESDQVMLIYEHMSQGSLRDHLYGSNAESSDLNWKRRLKIALDAAQGLEYLHVGCTPKIIHRDIKTANILLDSNLNGKLADFGLSRMATDVAATHVTTAVKGTFGYLDPEYYNTQMLTEKSDVYSFGVVLLEIISGRAPIDTNLPDEKVNIVRWVTPYLLETDENGGQITEIIDKRLCGGYDMKSMSIVAKIAMRCVEALPSCRPSVREVVAELREAMKHEEDKDSLSIAQENGDVLTGEANSNQQREGMEWCDNSSNIPNTGR